jgi:folate-binding protein YgfZ
MSINPELSVLYDIHKQHNANFIDIGGFPGVADYGDVDVEALAVHTEAVILDLSHRGKIKVTGKDAAALIHGQTTNDIKKLKSGEGCHTVMISHKAKVLADFDVYNMGEYLLLDTHRSDVEYIIDHLSRHRISMEAELTDITDTLAYIAVEGIFAENIIDTVFGFDISNIAPYNMIIHRYLEDVYVIRRDWTKDPGVYIYANKTIAPKIWQELLANGAKPVGLNAWDIVRLEMGEPRYGLELDDSIMPPEANMEYAISYNKGCYVGQETITRIKSYGHVNKNLFGFVLTNAMKPPYKAKVMLDGAEEGYITSSVYSPYFKAQIALGYLRRDAQAKFKENHDLMFEIEAQDYTNSAKVKELPFRYK